MQAGSHYYNLPHTITVFPPALLTLLIPNTTANHTITYTNYMYHVTAAPTVPNDTK